MANKASTKAMTRAGTEVTLYGQMTEDGTQVRVWSKDCNYGFYNIERFDGAVLSASSFRKFFA